MSLTFKISFSGNARQAYVSFQPLLAKNVGETASCHSNGFPRAAPPVIISTFMTGSLRLCTMETHPIACSTKRAIASVHPLRYLTDGLEAEQILDDWINLFPL
jgi:hypothetical protein